jgi:hypothetical protein
VVTFGLRHAPASPDRLLTGVVVRARLYDRALSADEVASSYSAADDSELELVFRLGRADRARRYALRAEQRRLEAELSGLESRSRERAYAVVAERPGPTRLLEGGQVTRPAGAVLPGGVAAVGGARADFGLPANAGDGERRRRLVLWLTDRENPLFTRVLVNRVWHYHFGIGIVETPNDLGFNGGRPSHPELLDWLAAEFAASGYRLKHIHRLLVTSAAYRQASAPRATGLAVDADSRLLWRKRPLRVEAEVLRDAMLSVAGLLNRAQGGPGFAGYRETFLNGTTYFEPIDRVGADFQRRSVYRFAPRGANQGFLEAFDCPDTAAAAPRRSTTTTPLQALALWNGAFALRMAEAFAARVADEEPGSLDRQVVRAFQVAFQRDPRPAERMAARRLAAEHGVAALCRVLLNTNEFLTAD